jgi:hypothetical protein
MLVQPDGGILVGGFLTEIGGLTVMNLARLHADGTVDASFNPGADSAINQFALQHDGKILVAGWFTSLAGQPRNRLGRLLLNGTLD